MKNVSTDEEIQPNTEVVVTFFKSLCQIIQLNRFSFRNSLCAIVYLN